MNRTWRLFQAQIINFFPVNELREPGNRKKNTTVMIGAGVLAVIAILCIYNVLIAQALAQAGGQELIPAYMAAISSFAILFLTMFRSNGLLFGSRDMDMLFSLPVRASEIIGSKFLFLYFLNLLAVMIFMSSGGIVWIIYAETDLLRFIIYFISIFFVPFAPMCLASFISLLGPCLSSRFKNKNELSLLFSFAVLALFGFMGISGSQSEAGPGDIRVMLAEQITGIFPPAKLFMQNAKFSATAGMIVFILLSSAIGYGFVKITAEKYAYFHTLANVAPKYTRRKSKFQSCSPFRALYRKELGRFFSSYMAVLNSGFGVFLLCLFSFLLLVLPPQQLGDYLGIEDISLFLSKYAPLVVAAMLCLSCPSAFLISLEGRNIWILQTSPVSITMILNSKIAVNLTLHALGYLLALSSIMLRLNMNRLQLISLLLIPVCYSFFIAVLGIFLNKQFTNYEWDSETMVIKQSIPVMVSSFTAMAVIAAPVLVNVILAFPILPTLWVTAAILVSSAIIMYQKICSSGYL